MTNKFIYTVCTGRCGQFSLNSYVNKFSTNTISEGEPIEPLYKPTYLFSSIVRSIERKLYAKEEILGRGKMLEWYDKDNLNELRKVCNKRINRSNNILKKTDKQIYFEISKFFIRSYGEETIQTLKNIKILYLTRDPILNAVSFINRSKDFKKDNFQLNFKKNIFKIENLNLFESYLWMWIEIKLRLLNLKEKYNFEIINFKCENIDNLEKLSELFKNLEIEHKSLYRMNKLNTNIMSGYKETKANTSHLEMYENFKKKVPEEIYKKVPEFFDYEKY